MEIVEIVFLIIVAILVVGGLWTPVQERLAKRRAESLIALDRIARRVDAGQNQLSIGRVSKAYRQGPSTSQLKQYWNVPISYRANDPDSRDWTITPVLKLDGTDDLRAIEDKLIRDIEYQRQMIKEGY